METKNEGFQMEDERRWSIPWVERPVEEARIFNPAFCGELIARTVGEYHRTRETTLSVATAFLVLPLVLHRPTRKDLPRRADKVFAGWVAEHSELLFELPDRTRRLRPITREALLFAACHRLLEFTSGELVPSTTAVGPRVQFPVSTDEVEAIRRAAGLLGRWFARQGTQASILRGMGVTP